MKTTKKTHDRLVTLATPYYGSITRPHGKPEQIYLKLVANPRTGEFDQTEVCVWDPKKLPHLPEWLSKQGIETVLCNDNPPQAERFLAAGIKLFRKQKGELQEMILNWTVHMTKGDEILAT